jgi:uncharacterized membrane protein
LATAERVRFGGHWKRPGVTELDSADDPDNTWATAREWQTGKSGTLRGTAEHAGETSIDRLALREMVRAELQGSWLALLPAPETLAEYSETCPGTAELILCMAEQSVIRKLSSEAELVKADIASAKKDLRVTVSVIVLTFAVAAVSFALEYQVVGIAFVAISVAALIRSSIHERRTLLLPGLPARVRVLPDENAQ